MAVEQPEKESTYKISASCRHELHWTRRPASDSVFSFLFNALSEACSEEKFRGERQELHVQYKWTVAILI